MIIAIRLFIFPHSDDYWLNFRQQLQEILLSKKIFLEEKNVKIQELPLIQKTIDIPLLVDRELVENQLDSFENKQAIIKELRSMGLNGILICLFLIKNGEVFCTARNIFRSIDLPQTTGYRYIQKLLDSNYIFAKHTFDDPNSNYFQLTVDGKFLVYDLYKMIRY